MSSSAVPSESTSHSDDMPIKINPQNASPLFKLPAEMRIKIYKHLCGYMIEICESSDGLYNPPHWLDFQLHRSQSGLLEEVRVLELDTHWINRSWYRDSPWHWCTVKWDGEPETEEKQGHLAIRELVQLRGVEVRFFPNPEHILLQSGKGAEVVALSEVIGQPKTFQGYIKLSEDEKDEAAHQVVERGKKILSEALARRELQKAQHPASSRTPELGTSDDKAEDP
ncbi:MAG: hypothetical protein Q9160_001090 [Pyrenula sp. 1 TL-2023]